MVQNNTPVRALVLAGGGITYHYHIIKLKYIFFKNDV